MSLFSRRALLASASTLLLSAAGQTTGAVPAERPWHPGRINLGLCGVSYYMAIFPFINLWKSGAAIQVVAGGVNYWSDIPPGGPNSAWDAYLDGDGELARPLPSGITRMSRIFYAPADEPPGHDRAGQRWVLKWDGLAKSVSIAGAVGAKQILNRIEWTWPSKADNMWVTFADLFEADPPHNIRLCEQRYEKRLDAGEIFNPDWLAKVRDGSGIVRFMGWQSTNFNRSTLRFADIPGEKYTAYGADTSKPFIKGGMPLSVMSRLANEVQSHPWVCIPNVLGTRQLSAIAAISNANPALVTSPGHKWADGDQVVPYGTNWQQIERNRFTVINANRKAGTFALDGLDSTKFGRFDSDWASVTSPYDLESIAKEVTPLAAHFRDHVDSRLVTYFEFGNELWNYMFNAPHWLAAQARGEVAHDDSFWMSGYLAAHCMKVVRDTYGPAGRDKWRGVLATQTVNPDITARMINGADSYIEKRAHELNITDLFHCVAVTGYFGGSTFSNARKEPVFQLMDESEQRWKNGLTPTKYSYFNQVVNEDNADGGFTHGPYSVDKIGAFWTSQKTIADAHGWDLIQYEGGNGNTPDFFGILNAAEQARFMQFYKQSCHTAEDARNYTAMFNLFAAIGGKYPAKFVEAGAVSRYGNWGALRYPGDSNPVWDVVVAFNRRA